MKTLLLVCLCLLTAGCASTAQVCPEPVTLRVPYEVKVPVYVERTVPAELKRKYTPMDFPKFIAPTTPGAAVALDKDGVDKLKIILRTLKTRDDAWRAWATPGGK